MSEHCVCKPFKLFFVVEMPNKACPLCSAVVHIRKLSCDNCGHVFVLRRMKRISVKTRQLEKQSKRALDTFANTLKHREQDKIHVATCRALRSNAEKNISGLQIKHRMQNLRATESQEQKTSHRQINKEHMQLKRAEESGEQKTRRRQSNEEHMQLKRTEESEEQKTSRRQNNKEHMSVKRAKDTHVIKNKRRIQNKQAMAESRASNITVESAIAMFLAKIQYGPEYVCMSCRGMMYNKGVVEFNREKYSKTSDDVLSKVFSSEYKCVNPNGKMYVCKTCHSALSRGNMPILSKANGLELSKIPFIFE